MKNTLKKITRRKNKDSNAVPAEGVPRITNETVAAHREEVLSSARKYKYPLHSKHRVVVISTTLAIISVVAFTTYCTVALYRLQSSSTFLYRVTQVIPFPIARINGQFVAYENYLFELRRYTHYYESQQKVDFGTEKDRQQLTEFKKRALDKVINDAYIKQLARTNDISVSEQEVTNEINRVREQNRLGSSDKVFEDVLKDYWGWSVNDFRRSLKQQLLAQKVVAKLDSATQDRASTALQELKGGADFAATAKKYSDDPGSKESGGDYGFAIDKSNRDISPQATSALFSLQPGQITEIVNTGYSLEIIKLLELNGGKAKAAHIVFNFKDISTYVNELKEKQKARSYINL